MSDTETPAVRPVTCWWASEERWKDFILANHPDEEIVFCTADEFAAHCHAARRKAQMPAGTD